MTRRALVALLLPVLLATGACAEARETAESARDTAGTVRDCAELATEVARSGLSGVPTPAEAEQAAQRLDDRVRDLEAGPVRDAAGTLRDRLRDVQEAVGKADRAAVTDAVDAARAAATRAAEACGLPAEQFLG